ncbi:hypothetical protein J3A64_004757 [Pseudarthrobacter sp. PvP004]|uniref:DUF4192 domain-containing protein n=1 Tax=Pseudarthrobacter sp. PvP004 TaxID=2817850 RepID=UPI001AE6DD47|nr:DUF4192 domain-containing protein [Pseudarthrobacter sp. PvP004]MBP2269217.1 hypothetical protein [Pseudarthrobacter sp. PvP004]
MNNELRISSPADILGFIPHTLGFVPSESFVFVSMRGNTLGATLRVNAPAHRDPAGFAASMLNYLALDELASSVLLTVYSDAAPETGTPRPFHHHVEAIIEALERAGTPLRDAWLITSDRWKNLLCDDTLCCQPQPLETITDGHLNAEMVFRGSTYQKQPGTTYPPFNGPEDTAERIDHAGHVLQYSGAINGRELWSQAIRATGSISPDTTVQLLACFQYPSLRDTLMCNVIDPDRTDADGCGNLLMGHGIAPDWDRVDRAEEAARALITGAPRTYRAPLLTLIGWLAYLKGQSTVAAEHFTAAMKDTPGYRLAELLDEVVNQGTIAPVAADEATAYKKHH